jgi:Fe-S-cluster-containing hydrogenase component 2
LTLAYTLAGTDCIDVAADPAVIASAQEGMLAATKLAEAAEEKGFPGYCPPWLMVSLNDGEDPHFRKAEFNPNECPTDCPRPCEQVCPAQAITFSGVIDQRCYGCGRCLPVCPSQLIFTRPYVYTQESIAPLVLHQGIDAIEIHTQIGRTADFQRLWRAIEPEIDRLKLIAISCPDGDGLIDYLWELHKAIAPLPCPLIWQTDGRPMSGDIGIGTTHAAIKLGEKVLAAGLPGYVQLAGGTNQHTVTKLQAAGLLQRGGEGERERGREGKRERGREGEHSLLNTPNSTLHTSSSTQHSTLNTPHSKIAGVAYGSYARVLLSPILEKLEKSNEINPTQNTSQLEDNPQLLWEAVATARCLVSQIESSVKGTVTSCG